MTCMHFKHKKLKIVDMVEKKIGLLGGSFNPAHSGHVQITLTGLKCFYLDEIWWLVSPGNPLKKKSTCAFGNENKKSIENNGSPTS